MAESTDHDHTLRRRSSRQKQAACLECRRNKIKCHREPLSKSCQRCVEHDLDCRIPEYRVGRFRGAKNKPPTFDAALSQLESVINSTSSDMNLPHRASMLEHLQVVRSIAGHTRHVQGESAAFASTPSIQAPPGQKLKHHADSGDDIESLAVDNAGNPLEMLILASSIPNPDVPDVRATKLAPPLAKPADVSTWTHPRPGHSTPRSVQPHRSSRPPEYSSCKISKLDVGEDLDPVQLGLVSMEECEVLFTFFHEHLVNTRFGLDPNLHTLAYVRSRSAFLFTSILRASSLFVDTAADLCRRLSAHVKHLVHIITTKTYRSPEIVLGFILIVPFLDTGTFLSPTQDVTCYYLATALSIAIDLSLHKIVVPSTTPRPQAVLEKLMPQNSIAVDKALHIDNHYNLVASSHIARRILRSRERIWLCLYVLEQGVCLARGRTPIVPAGMVVDTCDGWHISDISDQRDAPLIAATVLRRDTHKLISSIRITCDSDWQQLDSDSLTAELLKERIEKFFALWESSWAFQVQPDGKLTPYLKIVAAHTALAVYCGVISHPTIPTGAQKAFRTAALESALNVMRTALDPDLQQMALPNNTIIMVAFAACFYLGLAPSTRLPAKSDIRALIGRIADLLEKNGSSSHHLQRTPVIFCQHIRCLLAKPPRSSDMGVSNLAHAQKSKASMPLQSATTPRGYVPLVEIDPLEISDMTYDQILEEMTLAQSDIDFISANYLTPVGSISMDFLDLAELETMSSG